MILIIIIIIIKINIAITIPLHAIYWPRSPPPPSFKSATTPYSAFGITVSKCLSCLLSSVGRACAS